MKNKLYSLLVGITDYPAGDELFACVKDAEKIKTYLDELKEKSEVYNIQKPVLLTNNKATKNGIAKAIKKMVKKLKDGDTFVFYFSGHGTREISEGRFKEDHNGWLETIVCHHEDGDKNYLLADKELRYLFHQCESVAHILTIFDCCHSGDIMRGKEDEQGAKKQLRRISAKQDQRPYNDFLFKSTKASNFKNSWFDEVFEDANVLTISACQSDQSSWEGDDGGYFTNALLEVLNKHDSIINYNDLAKKIEISVRNKTGTIQTPNIGIIGKRKYNQLTSWLRLNGDELRSGTGFIQYNDAESSWIYSKGSIFGVKEGDTIVVRVDTAKEIEATIGFVNSYESIVEILSDDQIELDKSYPVISPDSIIKPKVFVYDEDGDEELYQLIKKELKKDDRVEWVKEAASADFQINIFNHCIYYSFPNNPYRPLNRQLDLMSFLDDETKRNKQIKAILKEGNKIIANWHHLKTLEKHDDFTEMPIQVEIKIKGQNQWIDLTNGNHTFKSLRHTGNHKQLISPEFEIRVNNKYDTSLYIAPLALFQDKLEISSEESFFKNNPGLVEAGRHIPFRKKRMWLGAFQEIYNWPEEVAYLKFVVSTNPNVMNIITEMSQSGFNIPLTHLGTQLRGGGGGGSGFEEEKWGVYTTTLHLPNTSYNQISGTLEKKIQWYKDSEVVGPFIERLYFDISDLNNGIVAKPNANKQKSFKMWVGNVIDHQRRARLFKKLQKKFPDKPIVIAEGDSWFLYPILVKDTIDYVMEHWPVKSLAWAGDTLENYKKSGKLLKQVKKLKPKYVLLSGGGNDIIGPDIQKILKKNAKNVTKPSDYLDPEKYGPKMNNLRSIYKYFFKKLSKADSVEKILVHGYDYVRADHATIVTKDGWVNKYMEKKGIKKATDRTALIEYLIDQFNGLLKSLANDFPDKVVYIDGRGVVGKDEWYDEIHPNDAGFKKVANLFLEEMQ